MNYKELAIASTNQKILSSECFGGSSLLQTLDTPAPTEANSIKQKCSKDACETGREVFQYIPARKTEGLFLCCSQKGDLIKHFAESPSAEISPSAPETMHEEKQGKPQTNKQPLAHQDVWVRSLDWIYLKLLPELFPIYIYICIFMYAYK